MCYTSQSLYNMLWWKWTKKKTNFEHFGINWRQFWDNKTITIAMSILGKWVVSTLFAATTLSAEKILLRWCCLFVCLSYFWFFFLFFSATLKDTNRKNWINVKVEMNACHHKKCEHIEPFMPSQTEIIRSLSHVSSVFHFHRCCWISMTVKWQIESTVKSTEKKIDIM